MTNVAEIYQEMSYGPAPEEANYVRDWLAKHGKGFGFFIDGEWVAPKDQAQTLDSFNPATREKLAMLSIAGADDVDAAVSAATAAFPEWSSKPGFDRARVLYALARLIQKNSRFLAVLETLDNGKPIRETRDIDVPLAARHFYHHAGWAQILAEEFAAHAPLGVVAQVIPWNFPLLMLAWKIAPAIAAGNCVVLKPAEYTSLSALYFAELAGEAGVPPGVINIITGAGETGALLTEHGRVAKVAFTGSTDVGRAIREKTAGSGKKLTLELGGKSPFIVFEDADLDSAVEGLVDAIWFNQGEVCCAGSRLLVEESVADRLVTKVKARLEKFRLGDPLDKSIDMGAIVDPVQLNRIQSLLHQSEEEGADLWQPDIPCPDTGSFCLPTLITNVAPGNTAVIEEIFGPVLTVMSFRTLAEAAALANNTAYGLAASVWSENINRALDVAGQIKAGVVWVNTTNQFDAACGFGGYRESGFGREGGREGMFEYLKLKDEWLPGADAVLPCPSLVPASDHPIRGLDRTHKNYIGGKQKRADGGNTNLIAAHDGRAAERVGKGNRKDIRDAVEAAFNAASWGTVNAHTRAQILYFMAENLSVRAGEFQNRLKGLTGISAKMAKKQVDCAISRLFSAAAWADKFDGLVHAPPVRNISLAVNEPLGVLGIVCPDTWPLLSFVSLLAPAMAMGNRCVIIPSERFPLPAMDFYQILETSDVPAGVVNIVTGTRDELAPVLAGHAQVDGLWYHGTAAGSRDVERLSATNLKRTWVNHGAPRDWFNPSKGEGRQFLREATQVKNIWLPYQD